MINEMRGTRFAGPGFCAAGQNLRRDGLNIRGLFGTEELESTRAHCVLGGRRNIPQTNG
jgi:hypothetical protein